MSGKAVYILFATAQTGNVVGQGDVAQSSVL